METVKIPIIINGITVTDTKTGLPIYYGDLVNCFNDAALDESWMLDKIHRGVMVLKDGEPQLEIGDIYLSAWYNAEHIEK